MAELNETTIAQLAREMVMNIRPYKVVFEDFGITEEAFYEIAKTEYYQRVKDHYTLEWNSALSAADRVRLISASFAEQGLTIMGQRMKDPTEPLTSALDTFKTFCKNAGIGVDNKAAPTASERFVITINLGADTEHYNKSIEINPNDTDLPAITKGETDGKTTEEVPKRKVGRPKKETQVG